MPSHCGLGPRGHASASSTSRHLPHGLKKGPRMTDRGGAVEPNRAKVRSPGYTDEASRLVPGPDATPRPPLPQGHAP
jgi:hypothetical protein